MSRSTIATKIYLAFLSAFILLSSYDTLALRFSNNEQHNSSIVRHLASKILEHTKDSPGFSFPFEVNILDHEYVVHVSGSVDQKDREVLTVISQPDSSHVVQLSVLKPGHYEFISKDIPVAKQVIVKATLLNVIPEHILPFGSTFEESIKISQSIVQTLLAGRLEGSVQISPIENSDYAQLPAFTGLLTFSLSHITFSDEFEHQDFPQHCSYQLKKLRENVSRYYIQIETPGLPWIAFDLNFISGITYDGWQKLIHSDETLFQDQYNATLFHTHCLVGAYIEKPISTMCLMTVGWVAELQLCFRMLNALKSLDVFAYIFVVPNSFDGISYGGMNNRIYSAEKVSRVQDLRRRFYKLFNPQLSFLTHYSIEPNRIADEYIIGYWSGFVSYVTPLIEKALMSCDSLAYSSHEHAELDQLLKKNNNKKPLHFFAPSSQMTDFKDVSFKRLFYCGINWDKLRSSQRYKDFFVHLEKDGIIDVYGPKHCWQYLSDSYKGMIIPGADELYSKMQECGVVLCLHSDEHLQYGISSSRFFEAVSSSCLVICDRHPFFMKAYKDCCLFLDEQKTAKEMATQVLNYLLWIKKNPLKAKEMCQKAHHVFLTEHCLEKQFYNTILDIGKSIKP